MAEGLVSALGPSQLSHLGPDPFGDLHRPVQLGLGQDQGKLLAAVPRRGVDFPHAAAHDASYLREQLVTERVPVAVV